ncbi:ANTAR domain-containing protein [Amycolatopsis sp. H6(2020)]|nr:ANTAR domain-containing protein [Amycolatopsis sp. H6(2020)]
MLAMTAMTAMTHMILSTPERHPRNTAVEAVLRSARRFVKARDTTAQLRTALTSRATIDQAKGVLMALHRIPADAAFALLVAQSQQENVKLRTIADRFIAGILDTETGRGR